MCIGANDSGKEGEWAEPGDPAPIEKKSPGKAIMTACFFTQDGELRLLDGELEDARKRFPNIQAETRFLLKIGKSADGYMNNDQFVKVVENALLVAQYKFPRDKAHEVLWFFDQSGVHVRFADDALNVSKMNLNPGGKQPEMHDSYYQTADGEVIQQSMVDNTGVPKGVKQILQERGLWKSAMHLAEARSVLQLQPDFRGEICILQRTVEAAASHFKFHLIPKFHCEFNPVELVWAFMKRLIRHLCTNNFAQLEEHIEQARLSVSKENCQNFFRKCEDFRRAYSAGAQGATVKNVVATIKKVRRSHPTIQMTDREFADAVAKSSTV